MACLYMQGLLKKVAYTCITAPQYTEDQQCMQLIPNKINVIKKLTPLYKLNSYKMSRDELIGHINNKAVWKELNMYSVNGRTDDWPP